MFGLEITQQIGITYIDLTVTTSLTTLILITILHIYNNSLTVTTSHLLLYYIHLIKSITPIDLYFNQVHLIISIPILTLLQPTLNRHGRIKIKYTSRVGNIQMEAVFIPMGKIGQHWLKSGQQLRQ